MHQYPIVEQLKNFAPEIATFGESISPNLIIEFENLYGVQLPCDYKSIISLINGFSIMGSEVYGIGPTSVTLPLHNVYQFEHFEVSYPQPLYLIPFSPDGGGNFYCFDTRYQTSNGNSYSIVFWVSNFNYTVEDQPEIVFNTFTDFVQEVIINWTLEEYDYSGKEKE